MRDRLSKRTFHIVVRLVILGLTTQIMYTPIMYGALANPDSPVSGAIIVATGQAGSGFNFTMPNGNYVITQGLTKGIYNVSTIAEGYISQNVGESL